MQVYPIIDALIDAVQFIDAVRQDAIQEGWWTEWDQQMREKITKALEIANGLTQQSEDR